MDWQQHIATAVISVVTAVLIARLSKTRGERIAELLDNVSQAANMTAEQLIQKITLISTLEKRIEEQEQKNELLEKRNSVLWQYVYVLLEKLKRHKIKPPLPPEELLESDPKLRELVNGFGRRTRKQ